MNKLILTLPICLSLLSGCAQAPLVQGGAGPSVTITPPPPPPMSAPIYSASELVYQCQQAWQNSDIDLAISKCRESTEKNPNYAPAYEKLAEIYLSINDKNQAIQMYLKAAGIYRLEGRCEEPRTLYYKILGLYPNYSDATIGLKEVERNNCGLSTSNRINPVTNPSKKAKNTPPTVIREKVIITRPPSKSSSKSPPATGGGKALKESEW